MRIFRFRRAFASLACGLLITAVGSAAAHANNVQVALEGEQLKITGDNLGNAITVQQSAGGDVLVLGRNGTTVNRLPSVRFRLAVLDTVQILMQGGDDNVVISGLVVSSDIFVNLGAGNDVLSSGSVPAQVQNNVSIEGADGNDTVRLTGWSIASDLYIDGQVGALTAQLSRITTGFSITCIGDAFRDVVRLTNCSSGDFVTLETKGGNDLVEISGLTGLGLAAVTDNGSDIIKLTNVTTQDDVAISTGQQNDMVEMVGVTTDKNIIVSLAEGADVMDGTNVFAQFDAVFEGGAGVDTYIDEGIFGGVKTEVKEFEILP